MATVRVIKTRTRKKTKSNGRAKGKAVRKGR